MSDTCARKIHSICSARRGAVPSNESCMEYRTEKGIEIVCKHCEASLAAELEGLLLRATASKGE